MKNDDKSHGLGFRESPLAQSTYDAKAGTIDVTLASETPCPCYDRGEMVDEVLLADGAEWDRESVPFQDSHDRYSVEANLGSVRNMRKEPGGLIVGQVHFASTQKAKDTEAKYRDRHLRDVSVGYRTSPDHSIRIGKKEKAMVLGREFQAANERGMVIRTKWQIREVSAVAIGADPVAKSREFFPASDCSAVTLPLIGLTGLKLE